MKTLWLWIVIRKQLLTFWSRGKIFDIVSRKHRSNEGWCMCGGKIEDHGYDDGHGPVDAWHYYRDQFVYKTGARK
jgi:hypothetical protein